MSNVLSWFRPESFRGKDPIGQESSGAPGRHGHAHFWQRALSRRQFLWTAGGTAAALGTGLVLPTPALAASRDPRPIPGGFANPAGGPFIHHNFPGPADAAAPNGSEPSLITDFDGVVGVARVQGTGTGTNTNTGDTFPLLFDADQRFMTGLYRGVDGRFREATFAFI